MTREVQFGFRTVLPSHFTVQFADLKEEDLQVQLSLWGVSQKRAGCRIPRLTSTGRDLALVLTALALPLCVQLAF